MPNVMLWGEDMDTGKPMVVKVYDNSIWSIDWVHGRVHAGTFFNISYYDAAVTAGAARYVYLQPGTTKHLHTVFGAASGGDSEFYFFEGTNNSVNGTTLTAVDSNRVTANTAEGLFTHTPTISATGNLLYTTYIPGGGFFGSGGSGGGPIRDGTEVILNTNTGYLLKFVNAAGTAQGLHLAAGFYED